MKHLLSPPSPWQAKQSPSWVWIPGARRLSQAQDSEPGRVFATGSDQQPHGSKPTSSSLSLSSPGLLGSLGGNRARDKGSGTKLRRIWLFSVHEKHVAALSNFLPSAQAPERRDSGRCRQKCPETACAQSLDVPARVQSCSYPHQLPTPLKP